MIVIAHRISLWPGPLIGRTCNAHGIIDMLKTFYLLQFKHWITSGAFISSSQLTQIDTLRIKSVLHKYTMFAARSRNTCECHKLVKHPSGRAHAQMTFQSIPSNILMRFFFRDSGSTISCKLTSFSCSTCHELIDRERLRITWQTLN
jgi:hypothetical protein